jgi:TIR domain
VKACVVSHDIFISYSRRDTERMSQVRDGLRAANFQVWTDEGIEPGTESWKQALSSAIKDCKYVVVLFSPDSAESAWVNRELDFAELHKKKIYPLLVKGEPEQSIPFGYTTFQFIDIRDDQKVMDGLQKLVDTLKSHADGSEGAAPTPPESGESAAPSDQPQQEILWKWVETPQIRLTLPATAKSSEPSEANLQRIVRLLVGNDDSLQVRVFRNWDKLAPSYTGVKSATLQPLLLFSDVASLFPIVGIISELKSWVFTPFTYLIVPRIARTNMIAEAAKKQFDAEVSKVQWMHQSGKVMLSTTAYLHSDPGAVPVALKVFAIFSPGVRNILAVNMSCEQSRFASAEPIFDQIAKSMTYP